MQYKKANIRTQILQTAKEEFIAKGYKHSSMRNIAKKSNVALSNIYNYFRTKDDILKEVLKPLLNELDDILIHHNSNTNISKEYFTNKDLIANDIERFSELTTHYQQELNLLLFNSAGSCFENFRNKYTNKHTNVGLNYLMEIKKRHPEARTHFSYIFIYSMSSWWLSNIEEIISHKLSPKETKDFFTDYISFATAGWKEIMRI